jgi:hypothetical protein
LIRGISMDAKIIAHSSEHKFSRAKFIKEIIGFSDACVSVGEKGLSQFYIDSVNKRKISPDNIETLSDEHLIKIHKFFWDGL